MKLTSIFVIFLPLYSVALKGNENGAPREFKLDLLWTDESLDGSRWVVENDSGCRAMPSLSTSTNNDDKYLRVKLDSSVFGVAILRSSVFTARPGDRFSFSYFVSSLPSRPLTNLQLSFATLDKKESLLVDIRSILPEEVEEEWQTISGDIPVENPTELTLVFYGFCGDSDRDVVAIDDITVDSNGYPSSSTEQTGQPSTSGSTPETTLTTTALTCPSETFAFSSVCTSNSAASTERSSSTALISTSTPTPTTTPSPKPKCPNGEDYDPCSCDESIRSKINIVCDRIGFKEVADVFNSTTPTDIDLLTLRIIEDTIPTNLIAESRLRKISIECVDVGQLLKIDVDALSSSIDLMNELKILSCDLGQLDFSFLNGFKKLSSLTCFTCAGFFSSWSTLPSLPSLTSMTLNGTTEEEMINSFPQFDRLSEIYIVNCWLSESYVDSILDAFAESASLSLGALHITNSTLTSVPSSIKLFDRLKLLNFHLNERLTILGPYGVSSGSISDFYFSNCNIKTIDPDAFTGVSNEIVSVTLANNKLTRLEYDAFWPFLQHLRDTGSLQVLNNPFDCTTDPCHLAWIIRDYRDELLDVKLLSAACDNGTKFSDLDVAFFDQCP